MRLLADANFPKPLIDALRADGHDVVSAGTDFPMWPDLALLDHAESDARIVLTLDKDFLQIAMQRRIPLARGGVVLFRVHPASPETLEPLIQRFVSANQTWAGHVSIITAELIHSVLARRD